ncbi:TetR family transcriptional regulator [Streptomyces sp. AJS327]|nr:TetR family transcriptional regulator [Streptomyces sp. AJS327]
MDHENRRHLVTEAVFRLAAERGLEAVTLRDVAASAGVSMGAVQRCFRTKEEMLVFALGRLSERVEGRVRERIGSSPAQSARSRLGHTLTEVALVHPDQGAEARVWLAFLAQAAVAPSLATVLRRNYAALHTALTRLLHAALPSPTGAGELAEAAEREAHALLALADGLTAHVLVGHLDATGAINVLDRYLERLWTLPDTLPGRPTPEDQSG